MKSIIKYIWSIFESIGRARAATYYARLGRHEEAKRIITEK